MMTQALAIVRAPTPISRPKYNNNTTLRECMRGRPSTMPPKAGLLLDLGASRNVPGQVARVAEGQREGQRSAGPKLYEACLPARSKNETPLRI